MADPLSVDTTTPNVARMYDYYLGGKDNFAVDREAAEQVLALVPGVRCAALEHRRFLRRAVRYLVAKARIDQFLDIGTGLPTRGNVHELARDARVVYVDYDPVVVCHGQALLTVQDRSIMVYGDLRTPVELLASPDLRAHLDLSRPVAITLLAVLHFIPDSADPVRVMATLRDAIAPGSYVVLSHVSGDFMPDKTALKRLVSVYEQASERIWPRTREQILSLFDGFAFVEPGLVPKHMWRPDIQHTRRSIPNVSWGGVALKC